MNEQVPGHHVNPETIYLEKIEFFEAEASPCNVKQPARPRPKCRPRDAQRQTGGENATPRE